MRKRTSIGLLLLVLLLLILRLGGFINQTSGLYALMAFWVVFMFTIIFDIYIVPQKNHTEE